MGGTGSGRWGGRPTVEGSLTLDVNELLRAGVMRRGEDHATRWAWTDNRTQQQTAEVIILACMADPEGAHLRLIHRDGDRTIADYRVRLECTVQRLGGVRWWFTCPLNCRRVAMLHLPRGATMFGSRTAYRLGYRSDRGSPRDRAIGKMHKLRRRLGGDPGRPSAPLERPRYMRQAAFERHLAELKDAETRACAFLVPAVEALRRRMAHIG